MSFPPMLRVTLNAMASPFSVPSSILAGSGAIELVTVPVTASPFTSKVKTFVRLLPSGP
jgi:hypothetical protein